MTRWHLRSRQINSVVNATDQFTAWDTLRERPLSDFGLVVGAEADENANPMMVHTSALLFRWGRDQEARQAIQAAIAAGLPDTTEADMRLAGREP